MFFRYAIAFRFFAALSGLVCVCACGQPAPDLTSPDGKQQILDQVDAYLNGSDCVDALSQILPLYDSLASDNNVRMHIASVYGCYAGIKLISLIDTLSNNTAQIATGFGFWELMSKLFPSNTGQDYVVEGGLLGTDALQAALNPGAIVLPAYQINPVSFNVGSPFPGDRIVDANLYMLFTAMASIGGLENRFGNPNPSYQKTTSLPWQSAALMDSNGCALASSVLNMLDAVGSAQAIVPTSLTGSLGDISGNFLAPMDQACEFGCNGGTPPVAPPLNPAPGNWKGSGCAFAAGSCLRCPTELRDRTRCKLTNSDKSTCAAAGIINLINVSTIGWQ